MSINGTLNLCKPSGRTSFDIVRLVRKLTQQKRVGHGGTLDPLASGVLPICIGQATRVTEFLAEADKSYEAQVVLGVATDTYDSEGKVVERGDPSSVTYEVMQEALQSFRGPIEQMPPMFSALKHQGKRLYELARAGVVVERKKRSTIIHRLEVVKWEHPLVILEVTCGRGAYIRSLVDDLGRALGCGAHLKNLVRLRTGPFDIRDSMELEEFTPAVEQGRWQDFLYPVDFALQGLDAAIIDQRSERAALSGQPVAVVYSNIAEGGQVADRLLTAAPGDGSPFKCRAYSADGRFLALLSSPGPRGPWAPKKVFSLG
ncbi:MAG: tRNA pseudouridine(55) synthase TruB [Dehalococcoidia bacterium]